MKKNNFAGGIVGVLISFIFEKTKIAVKICRKFIPSLLILLFFNNNAEAYFDPGTGSFVIQSIIGLGSAALIYLMYPFKYLRKIKDFLVTKISKKKEKEQKKENVQNKRKIK